MTELACNFQREGNFTDFIEREVLPFWQQHAQPSSFTNVQGLEIHYVCLWQDDADAPAIVICPGRVEGYLKYQELAFDLHNAGYQVFIIDHQGQGLSQRVMKNTHKGFVADFQDYVEDLHQFVSQIVLPKLSQKPYLLCHSMGGAIGLRMLQCYPDVFQKALFSSPMWGFLSGPVPEKIARGLVDLGQWVSEQFADESLYFVGGKNYIDKPFENNELTGSNARYQYFRQIYRETPELQLGGITFSWLQACILGLELAQQNLDKVQCPVLVLQAEKETVIDNTAQNTFCQMLYKVGVAEKEMPEVMIGAHHEVFIEVDSIRNLALGKIFDFLR